MAEFIAYYNQRRYHEGSATWRRPMSTTVAGSKSVGAERSKKELTIQARTRYNLGRREPPREGDCKLKTVAAASSS